MTGRWGPPIVAALALAATLATLTPGQGGPGIGCDEPYHAALGKRLVDGLLSQGLAFLSPENIPRNFSWPEDGPPVQAPLGHLLLGVCERVFGPGLAWVPSIPAARFAPAVALAALTLLIGCFVQRRHGPLAGTVAAASVVLVPRLFAHGHFAALDLLVACFSVAALLAVVAAASKPRWWRLGLAGGVWGLAMLVKLQGVLVAPPVVVWLLWRFRRRAVVPIAAWLTGGLLMLMAGWPWLWLDPLGHLSRYLFSGTGRTPVHVFYFGRVWDDVATPWHYPLLMVLVTLPVGLLVFGMVGMVQTTRRRRPEGPDAASDRKNPPETPAEADRPDESGETLLLGVIGWTLLVFAIPGVPVYDGMRLMLVVYPLWAVFVGIGAGWAADHRRWGAIQPSIRAAAIGLIILLQGAGVWLYRPCWTSHYSYAVGGLSGASRLGFEVNYWGDCVLPAILRRAARVADGEPVIFAPSLATFQVSAVEMSEPLLGRTGTRLIGWDAARPELVDHARYAIIYRRRADMTRVRPLTEGSAVVDELRVRGVWLTRLVRLPERPPPRRGSPAD